MLKCWALNSRMLDELLKSTSTTWTSNLLVLHSCTSKFRAVLKVLKFCTDIFISWCSAFECVCHIYADYFLLDPLYSACLQFLYILASCFYYLVAQCGWTIRILVSLILKYYMCRCQFVTAVPVQKLNLWTKHCSRMLCSQCSHCNGLQASPTLHHRCSTGWNHPRGCCMFYTRAVYPRLK